MDVALPLVSVITINYNALDLTCDFLKSLEQQSYTNIEVILVDNGSSSFPADLINEQFPSIKVIECSNNLGFAGGNNIGIQHSKGDYLFFVNNDTEVTPGLIEKLVTTFQQQPTLGALSPKILYFPEDLRNPPVIQYAGTTPIHPLTGRNKTLGHGEQNSKCYSSFYPTAYTHGAAMMIPKEVVKKAGMMPEDFFLYYEELDWCEKIRRNGYQIGAQLDAEIFHKESFTIGRESPLKIYYLTRSRILFMRRNFPTVQFFVFALFFILISLPTNLMRYLLAGKWPLINAFWKGCTWHLFNSANDPLPKLEQPVSVEENL